MLVAVLLTVERRKKETEEKDGDGEDGDDGDNANDHGVPAEVSCPPLPLSPRLAPAAAAAAAAAAEVATASCKPGSTQLATLRGESCSMRSKALERLRALSSLNFFGFGCCCCCCCCCSRGSYSYLQKKTSEVCHFDQGRCCVKRAKTDCQLINPTAPPDRVCHLFRLMTWTWQQISRDGLC